MLKKGIFITTLFIAFAGWSQTGTGSPYSAFSLGETTFRGNQINRLMGGLDIYNDSIHVNLKNPASYASLKLTNYVLGINYKSNQLNDGVNAKNVATASLDYLAVAIPAKKFGFGFGLAPYSSVGYRIETIDNSEAIEKINRFDGSGGMNQAFFSLGFPLFSFLNLGATLNYNFGNLSYRTAQFIDEVDLGSYLISESSVSGVSYQFAANLNIPIGRTHQITAMVSSIPEAQLNSRNQRIYFTQTFLGNTLSDTEEIDLSESGLDRTKLPISRALNFGFGIGKTKKWFLGAQRNTTYSANYTNAFINLNNVNYTDGEQLTVGGYFIPDYTSISSFWKRAVYRFGFRREQTGIEVNGSSISDTGISFGVGLPMKGFSNTNVGLEIGKRSAAASDLVNETHWALRIGFSLNDRWFIKRKYN